MLSHRLASQQSQPHPSSPRKNQDFPGRTSPALLAVRSPGNGKAMVPHPSRPSGQRRQLLHRSRGTRGAGPCSGASVPRPYSPPHHGCCSPQGDPWLKGSFTRPGCHRVPVAVQRRNGTGHRLPPAASSQPSGQAFLSLLSLLSAARSGEPVKQLSVFFSHHLLHQFREQGAQAAEVDTLAPNLPFLFPLLPPGLHPSPGEEQGGHQR